jgi:aspartokinase-like uncharacterized kinase
MDAVIKIGGSLAENPKALRILCSRLSEYSQKYDLAIVPGGGKFADVVRDYEHDFALSPTKSHHMAILGMDQFALLLTDIMPRSRLIREFQNLKASSESGEARVLLPSALLFEENPLENSWDVTSDSIAAYFAGRLRADNLILITDVDGIFTMDPKLHSDAKLIHVISAEELLALNKRTSVDRYLPKLLLKCSFHCYVVNGKHPERIGSILSGQSATCTQIVP